MRQTLRTGLVGGAVAACLLGLAVGPVHAQLRDQTQVRPTNDLPGPYERVHPWGELPNPYEPGAYDARASFIGADEGPDGNIYLLGRCLQNSCTGRSEPAILKLDPSGRLLTSWGSGLFDFPHGLDLDDAGNVWVADQRGHQVLKFDAEGTLLMAIGEKGTAGAPPLLDEPTDVVVAGNGDIFITEGHSFADGANRVTKYAGDGTFVMSWGHTGSGAGEFNVPHTIAIDSQDRLFVGDRANNRIQIFDQAGTLLDVWYQFGRPSGIAIGADDRIYVADSESFGSDNPGWKKGIRVGSARDGSVQYLIEDLEPMAIEHSGAEGVGVDSHGNVYGAVVRRRMLEKHVPGRADTSAPRANPAPPGNPAPTHIGHVAYGFGGAPGGRGLAATASAEVGTALLHANFAAGDLSDLSAMQGHAGHVLHLLEPEEGRTESAPGLGFGVIAAVEALADHLTRAARSAGASENVRTHTEHVTAIATGLLANAREAADVARQLQTATSLRRAAPLVARLRVLAYQITEGLDLDGDTRLSFDGEAGMQQLEAHLYLLLEGEQLARELHKVFLARRPSGRRCFLGHSPGVHVRASRTRWCTIVTLTATLWQHFQRYIAVQLGVAGFVHLAHPARANGRKEFVGAECGAGLQGHRDYGKQDRQPDGTIRPRCQSIGCWGRPESIPLASPGPLFRCARPGISRSADANPNLQSRPSCSGRPGSCGRSVHCTHQTLAWHGVHPSENSSHRLRFPVSR